MIRVTKYSYNDFNYTVIYEYNSDIDVWRILHSEVPMSLWNVLTDNNIIEERQYNKSCMETHMTRHDEVMAAS